MYMHALESSNAIVVASTFFPHAAAFLMFLIADI